MFNPESFLNQTSEQALSTQLDPVPEGDFKAVSQAITKESVRSFDINKGERAGQKGFSLNVAWKIDDEAAGEYNNRMVFQTLFLDVTSDGAGLDFGKGKNVDLGKLRAALGQNQDGQPWAPSMLGSQVAIVQVKQEVDKNDSSKIHSKVKGVASLN